MLPSRLFMALVIFIGCFNQSICMQRKTIFVSCNEDSETTGNTHGIYHLRGRQFGLFNIFSRLQVLIQPSKTVKVFIQTNKDDLAKQMEIQENGWLSRMFNKLVSYADGSNSNSNGTKWECSPFVSQYIGILSEEEENEILIKCISTAFDAKLLALFLAGVILFFFAEQCSRNVMFYYASGVTIGLLMSWMFILIVLLKLIPYKKSIFVVAAASGASFGLYLTQSFLINLQFYATYHANILIWYTIIVGLLTLAFLYYKGPPSNERFLNLTKWSMQGLGLLFIYNSTWAKEVAITAIVSVVSLYHILMYLDVTKLLERWISLLSPYRKSQMSKRRKFLTEEEFREEAERETAKALDELRGYCSSPECNTWKVVSRLKDPKRFASFMETGSMLSDAEIADYDQYEPEETNDSWMSSDDGVAVEMTTNTLEEAEESPSIIDESMDEK